MSKRTVQHRLMRTVVTAVIFAVLANAAAVEASVAPADSGFLTLAAAAVLPSNTARPVASGTAADGYTLSTTNGTWTGSMPMTYSYIWQTCTTATSGCSTFGGTASTQALTSAEVGLYVRSIVRATNDAGTVGASSVSVGPVTAVAPANTTAPAISGTNFVGSTLSATNGTWTGTAPITFTYQWQLCDPGCTDVPGADTDTFVPDASFANNDARVVVTATNAVGSTAQGSSQHGPIIGAPTNDTTPVASGNPGVGQTVSTTNGDWGISAGSFSYAWSVCDAASGGTCTPVPGATSASFTVTAAQLGSFLRATVTATNPAGDTEARSNRLGPVTAAASYDTTTPTPTENGQVTLEGSGFEPGSEVTFTIFSTPKHLGTTTTTALGTFKITFTLPAGLTGTHRIEASGTDAFGDPLTLSTTVEIAAAAPTTTTTVPPGPTPNAPGADGTDQAGTNAGAGDPLAHTGTNPGLLALPALMLVLLGAALAASAQRRRSTD